jgi:hypothetical protein
VEMMKSKIFAIWLCAMLVFSSAVVMFGNEVDAAKETEKPTFDVTIPVVPFGGGSFGGGNGTVWAPYIITDVLDLQNMSANLTANYTLGNDINASITSGWNGDQGFMPIGSIATPFTGTLDGRNFTVTGLFINRTGTVSQGLFGALGSGSELSNLGIANIYVIGGNYLGRLVGSNAGTVSNCYATGYSNGGNFVGGLVGYNTGTVQNSYATGPVSSASGERVGGLVGWNLATVQGSYATGNVSGSFIVGGLVGRCQLATPPAPQQASQTGAAVSWERTLHRVQCRTRTQPVACSDLKISVAL